MLQRELKQIAERYYDCSLTLARKQKPCHACGRTIPKGTFYLSFFICRPLFYSFHTSTMCRLKSVYACSMLPNYDEVQSITVNDIIWYLRNYHKKDELYFLDQHGFKNKDRLKIADMLEKNSMLLEVFE